MGSGSNPPEVRVFAVEYSEPGHGIDYWWQTGDIGVRRDSPQALAEDIVARMQDATAEVPVFNYAVRPNIQEATYVNGGVARALKEDERKQFQAVLYSPRNPPA